MRILNADRQLAALQHTLNTGSITTEQFSTRQTRLTAELIRRDHRVAARVVSIRSRIRASYARTQVKP